MTAAGALLPVAAFPLIWFLATVHRERLGLALLSSRGTFVVAHTVLQAVVLAITEILNVGSNIDATSVALAWVGVVSALAGAIAITVGREGVRTRWKLASRATIRAHAREWPVEVFFGLAALVWIVGALLQVGWIYPPNNTDSLVYHLTRVAHWIQESSVSHFATHWTGQIELAPLHEFDMLHLHLLTGSDRLDGYIQLASFVVCIVGASEVARLLGAGLATQVGAAVIAAVIPSAVLEATSTQNNLFGASIAMGLVVTILAWIPMARWVVLAALLGLGGGMAVIAKGTVLPHLLPAVLLLAIRLVYLEARASSWRTALARALKAVLVVTASAVLMAGPFLKRNYDVFGELTGPVTASTVNEHLRVREGAANVVRSVATNFRIGDGDPGIETYTSRAVLAGLRPVFEFFAVPPDDPDYYIAPFTDVFGDGDFSTTGRFEEFGANPWHVLLLTATGGLFVVGAFRGRRDARLPALLAIGLALGFVAFSATSRWSVYVARYSLPVLVIWAALIAIALSRLGRVVRNLLITLLVVAAVPQLLDNWPRSIAHPRTDFTSDLDAYFVGRALTEPNAADEFLAVRDAIIASGCDRVGIANWVPLEYPLWAGLENAGWHGEIEHVNVANESGVLEREDFEPCVLIRQSSGEPFPPEQGRVEAPFGSLSLSFENAATATATG